MNILVPTDFSENARNSFEFAKKYALLNQGSLTLIYTYYSAYDFAAQAAQILLQLEEWVRTAREELNSSPYQLEISHKIVHGTVATAVTSTAYREGYDLIIMGTQGASGIHKSLIGSNTSHVIKDSQIPVLAVPFDSQYEMVESITVAMEVGGIEKRFYDQLIKLTKNWILPFKAIHLETNENQLFGFSRKELEKDLKQNYPETPFTFVNLSSEDLLLGINQYLKNYPNTLLVMFSKKTSFFEYLFNQNKAIKMAYHTHVPLLVIK
jgi:nucleotide-binding universal stress UspA family protein